MWRRKSEPVKNKPIQSLAIEKPFAVADEGDGGNSSAGGGGGGGDTSIEGGEAIAGGGVFSSATWL